MGGKEIVDVVGSQERLGLKSYIWRVFVVFPLKTINKGGWCFPFTDLEKTWYAYLQASNWNCCSDIWLKLETEPGQTQVTSDWILHKFSENMRR